jgi:tetratricopeptide (TPR) repeat protein
VQAQAGLTRAAVLQVTGRLDEARQACQSLIADRFAALSAVLDLPAHACLAELRSLQGAPQPAALELAALARRSPGDRWLALVRAELAERMGDNRTAEAQFRSALAGASPGIASRGARRSVDSRDLGGSGRTAGRSGGGSSNASNDDATADVYTVAAYTDWLLSQGRNAEALASLERADPQADALLLRRAIALHRLGDAGSEASALEIGARLGARFDAARLRAENFHQREQARLALDLYGRADQALALALDNWTRQKEPADAVLLLRAAMAAGQPGAADPVQRLLAQGHADARLLRARQAAGSDVAQATVHRMQPVRGSPAAVTLVRTSVDQQTSQARP